MMFVTIKINYAYFFRKIKIATTITAAAMTEIMMMSPMTNPGTLNGNATPEISMVTHMTLDAINLRTCHSLNKL